ncbi:uncharacterized protein K460DRAFT_372460 [Cucurbitaria berberidis CBS 394.84]|uniref:F-box domain-containing protein n=1 Tax=Cucurbitaria berberidis CBS 394.84 TaxID=1168544 RepID=A0A9P4GRM5_9PLEO|nr:uncharacterized protein K460DRAFT_372460 [Cucurbitaria berberidis CBS 394.84]KAF1850090.1 hypothetical protein K460DRAFT_372460 [Cucurbitaria berberidis CBS 394.84]
MNSSSLDTLPEELIDRIISFTNSRATLHALCFVSKDINRIATAHLYTTIALNKEDFQHLRPLAFLLWTSEKHRNAIRSFSVRRAYGGNLDPWPHHSHLEEIIRRQIKFVRADEREVE